MKSYPKIYNLGHKDIANLLQGTVFIEEKVDGSQFSASIDNGCLKCRSRGKELDLNKVEKIFMPTVIAFKKITPLMNPDYVYRGEAFFRPKHNALAYERVPQNNVMIFDINREDGSYLSYEEKKAEAERLGFECVPLLYKGEVPSSNFLLSFLDKTSILGKQKIEGVVIKNYEKRLFGKVVSDDFKEVKARKSITPRVKTVITDEDFLGNLIDCYKTNARWDKAIQHLTEANTLKETPEDIGLLIKEIHKDVLDECGFDIKEQLFFYFWNRIKKGIVDGFAQYYLKKLAGFEDGKSEEEKRNRTITEA